ncbi:tyrosine-protein phosphatase [Gordonia sp. NPDC003425]
MIRFQRSALRRRAATTLVAAITAFAPVAATTVTAAAAPAVASHTIPVPNAVGVPDVLNARDFTNYTTRSGMRISGKVIRSANLSTPTPLGVNALERHQVRSIIDLRTTVEIALQPDKPVPGATWHHFDVLGAVPPNFLIDLPNAYRAFVTDPQAREAFRESLLNIEATVASGGTVVFHCTAGKDRTGWLAAVLLTILGVDRAVVNADYLASNTFRHASPSDAINGVNIGLLDAAFDTATQRYGSFDNYVHRGLRLSDADVAALRKTLLLPSI